MQIIFPWIYPRSPLGQAWEILPFRLQPLWREEFWGTMQPTYWVKTYWFRYYQVKSKSWNLSEIPVLPWVGCFSTQFMKMWKSLSFISDLIKVLLLKVLKILHNVISWLIFLFSHYCVLNWQSHLLTPISPFSRWGSSWINIRDGTQTKKENHDL